MAALVHRSLTNSQAIALAPSFGAPSRPSLLDRIGETLRLWRRRMGERHELASLSERELRDMRASHADVWHETNEWFWRASRPF
ncbi:MAG TPA: DUF1127 domain-containing protein [Acetobacteraceae bacterium]|nr:DUF1127 domain-containing protein [Acetobacteraceae bacterium]